MELKIGILKQNSSQHEHSFLEVIVCTEGCGIFHTSEAQFPISKGNIIIVPQNTPHYCDSDRDIERIFIDKPFDLFINISKPIILRNGAENDGVILAKLLYQNRYDTSKYPIALMCAFESYILSAIEIDDDLSLEIKSITREITECFHDTNFNLNAVLNKSGYSEDYIRTKFKAKTGKTPVEFLTEVRIEHACILIGTYGKTLSLSKIAESCGFSDYIYFSRRFKEFKGVSPREYMQKQALKQVN